MPALFRALSAIFFVSALLTISTLVISDVFNQLRLTSVHRSAGALSFFLIGSSYVGLQFSSKRPWNEMAKNVSLGIAFLLWGFEQFLPASPWVTAMDTAVVLIFVFDLSLIIVERLRRADHE